ncbi:MAG TPA: restriction endonuclease [bacterium]|nr:restriction endonuclease [bacterium]HPN44983.1 restriction endonuclease [bacterium]
MSKPSSQIIVTWILNELSNDKWLPLKDIIFGILKKNIQKWSDSKISDLVEEELNHISEMLRNIYADSKFNGEIESFEIDNEINPYIRSVNIHVSEIKKKLYSIDPIQFEHLCVNLLEKLGAQASITPQTRDGGIDFYAFEFAFNSEIITPKYSKIVVIGQAKRYAENNHVTEKVLREFIGSSIHKLEQFRNDKKICALTPVLYAFWTTSEVEFRAKKYAQDMGIWIMNGSTFADYVLKFKLL